MSQGLNNKKQELGPRPTRASLLRKARILKQQAEYEKQARITPLCQNTCQPAMKPVPAPTTRATFLRAEAIREHHALRKPRTSLDRPAYTTIYSHHMPAPYVPRPTPKYGVIAPYDTAPLPPANDPRVRTAKRKESALPMAPPSSPELPGGYARSKPNRSVVFAEPDQMPPVNISNRKPKLPVKCHNPIPCGPAQYHMFTKGSGNREELEVSQDIRMRQEHERQAHGVRREHGARKEGKIRQELGASQEHGVRRVLGARKEGKVRQERGVSPEHVVRRELGARKEGKIRQELGACQEHGVRRVLGARKEGKVRQERGVSPEHGVRRELGARKEGKIRQDLRASQQGQVRKEHGERGERGERRERVEGQDRGVKQKRGETRQECVVGQEGRTKQKCRMREERGARQQAEVRQGRKERGDHVERQHGVRQEGGDCISEKTSRRQKIQPLPSGAGDSKARICREPSAQHTKRRRVPSPPSTRAALLRECAIKQRIISQGHPSYQLSNQNNGALIPYMVDGKAGRRNKVAIQSEKSSLAKLSAEAKKIEAMLKSKQRTTRDAEPNVKYTMLPTRPLQKQKVVEPYHPLAPAPKTKQRPPAAQTRPSESLQKPATVQQTSQAEKPKKKKMSSWRRRMMALKKSNDDTLNSDIESLPEECVATDVTRIGSDEAKLTLPPIEAHVTPPQSPPPPMCTTCSLTDIALILPAPSECSVKYPGELKTALTDPDARTSYLSSSGSMSSRFERVAPSQLRRILRQAPNFTFQERESSFVCNDRPGYKIVWRAELEDGTKTIFDPTEKKCDKLPKGYFHFGFASVTYKYAKMMWEAKRKLRQVNGK